MKTTIYKLLKCFSGGFIVLLLISSGLFWGRFYCETFLHTRMKREWKSVEITPSGILPAEIENDPNVAIHSKFSGDIGYTPVPAASLGIFNYFEQKETERKYFDKNSGLIVYHFTITRKTTDNKTIRERIKFFAGPEGVAEEPVKELGRFWEPLKSRVWFGKQPLITYDRKLRRFFRIDFEGRKVTKGPEIDKGSNLRPIQIGRLEKNEDLSVFGWTGPQREIKKGETETEKRYRKEYKPIFVQSYPPGGQYLPVLDESGQIFVVDRESLEIAGDPGYLPAPMSFFGSRSFARPKDLLGFEVAPVAIRPDDEYFGMGVAALSREGTSMAAAVFDKEGKLIEQINTGIGRYYYRDYDKDGIYEWRRYRLGMDSSKTAFWGRPWSPFVTILRYLIENLQGPALSMATYFTADSFEASSGHRALFLLPNSFIGMKGRQEGVSLMWKFSGALLLMLPSIMLSLLLAWSVKKDAVKTGLSKREKLWWIAGVLCFGIAGYVCYRLCRQEVGLVSCQNCGLSRRVDMERCHRCGSGWVIPELQEPGWRIRDN